MRIFRVVLRWKNATHASLMRLSSTRPVMYLLRAVYVAKIAIMHPFYVFNTPWNVPVSRRFTSEIRPKFARFAPQMHVLRFEQVCNAHLSCRFTFQKCYKHVLNVSVFNTSCNVSAIMAQTTYTLAWNVTIDAWQRRGRSLFFRSDESPILYYWDCAH